MTDRDVVLRKLTSLREHTARLRRRRSATVDEFQGDVDVQDATAMSLLVAVQEAIDLALYLAADRGWGVPSSYAESFDLLAQRGVVEPTLAARLAGMAALRSRVAHGYATVDAARIWRELPAGIDALEQYAGVMARAAGN